LWLTIARAYLYIRAMDTVTGKQPLSGSPPIWEIALRDVNGDGLLDLAVSTGTLPVERQANEPLPRMQVWLNRYHTQSPAPSH